MAKNVYEVDQKLGGGELSLSACPGVGNTTSKKEKYCKFLGVCPGGGGEVTVKIAACITGDLVQFVTQASSTQCQGGKGLRDVTP